MRKSDVASLFRVVAVFVWVVLLYLNSTILGVVPGIIYIILIFFSDGLDGYLARNYDGETVLGGYLDILSDRITEYLILLPFVFLGNLTSIFIAFVIIRGQLIDFIRSSGSTGKAPFDQVKSKWMKFLVKSKLLRTSFAVVKLALIIVLYVQIFENNPILHFLIATLALFWIGLASIRSIPVFVQFYRDQSK